MKNKLTYCIVLCFLLSFSALFSVAQNSNCSVSSEDLNALLDTRKEQSNDYGQKITFGVSYILHKECDSAISYLRSANSIHPNECLAKILKQIIGNTSISQSKSNKASKSDQSVTASSNSNQSITSSTNNADASIKTFNKEELAEFQE